MSLTAMGGSELDRPRGMTIKVVNYVHCKGIAFYFISFYYYYFFSR